MIGVIKGGVALIIESIIPLSSHQMSEINRIAKTTDGMSSIQLDSIKKTELKKAVVSAMRSLKTNTNRTMHAFASTEALTKHFWS